MAKHLIKVQVEVWNGFWKLLHFPEWKVWKGYSCRFPKYESKAFLPRGGWSSIPLRLISRRCHIWIATPSDCSQEKGFLRSGLERLCIPARPAFPDYRPRRYPVAQQCKYLHSLRILQVAVHQRGLRKPHIVCPAGSYSAPNIFPDTRWWFSLGAAANWYTVRLINSTIVSASQVR